MEYHPAELFHLKFLLKKCKSLQTLLLIPQYERIMNKTLKISLKLFYFKLLIFPLD